MSERDVVIDSAAIVKCAYCEALWPRLHSEYLYDNEPHIVCSTGTEHVHLYPSVTKRPYEDRRELSEDG